jgi:hypothetical protein
MAAAFDKFDQFQRIVWHWVEINRAIRGALSKVPQDRQHFVRLEDLQREPGVVEDLFAFLGLPCSSDIAAKFARPHNVNRPEDTLLDERQRKKFGVLANPMMQRLGYAGKPEYVVKY